MPYNTGLVENPIREHCMMITVSHLLLPLLVIVMTGCVSTPSRPTMPADLPDSFSQVAALPMHADEEDWQSWWTRFRDPVLDRLVDDALSGNPDIHLQAQRVQEARAQLDLSTASRLPTLQAQTNTTRQLNPQTGFSLGGGGGAGGGLIFNQYSVSGLLRYEVDLWGRLANEQEAARALLEESVFGRDAVRLSITADVVTTYFSLRAAEARLRITRDNLATRESTLALEQVRYKNGATDRFTLRQAESAVAATRARLPALREQVQQLGNALAILTGRPPGDILAGVDFSGSTLNTLTVPDSLPEVLPSALLQRRPDIRSAEAALLAADANAAAVAASRWPTLDLAATLGAVRFDFGELLSETFEAWNTGATLAGPLYGFGRTGYRIESAEARREQAMIRYRQTVTNAFGEVRDALTMYETSLARLNATEDQVDAANATHELARIRYDEGLISFLELLESERAMLDAELQLAEARHQRLAAVATLFKALGGGWDAQQAMAVGLR